MMQRVRPKISVIIPVYDVEQTERSEGFVCN